MLTNRDQNLPMLKPGKTRNALPLAVHEFRNQPLTGRPASGTTSSARHGKRPQGSRRSRGTWQVPLTRNRPDVTLILGMYLFLNLKHEKEKNRSLSATRLLQVPGVPELGSGPETMPPRQARSGLGLLSGRRNRPPLKGDRESCSAPTTPR